MRKRALKKFYLFLLSADVFVHVIFVIFSLSRLPREEEKKFDTLEEIDGLSLIRSTAFIESFLQQRVLRKGRTEKNSILFS